MIFYKRTNIKGCCLHTGARNLAVLTSRAGVTAPILVVDLEQPVVPGSVSIHLADKVGAAGTLALHQAHPWITDKVKLNYHINFIKQTVGSYFMIKTHLGLYSIYIFDTRSKVAV